VWIRGQLLGATPSLRWGGRVRYARLWYNGGIMVWAMMVPARFSWWVLLGLASIFGASVGMFWYLCARWTTRRQWVVLRDWAGEHGFRMSGAGEGRVPVPLDGMERVKGENRVMLVGERVVVAQIQTDGTPGSRTPHEPSVWNVLVWEVAGRWPATGLRPAANARSVLDLFSMSSFPSLAPPERFVVFGTDSSAARALADSHVRALLPADVGLVVIGGSMVLDFSVRPFDGIAIGRLRALAAQVGGHLPGVG
jgi:hypothetical protein